MHRSVWLPADDRSSYPALDGDAAADLVVVGAGITGLTTALLAQRQGAEVVVLEADRVAAGTTGHTTGKVTSQHGLIYDDLVSQHGEHRARLYAQANQRAIATVAALVEETSADCQFERGPAYVYAETEAERDQIRNEYDAAVRLGLPATLTTEIDLPFDVTLALRFDDQAHMHAARYTAALARTLTAHGGRLFEQTRAIGIEEARDGALVHTATGDARAGHVVLATLLPIADRGGFFARARASRAYGIAVRLDSVAPTGMHINAGSPTRSTRPWVDGEAPGLIVVGETHLTGSADASPARWDDLERWALEHFAVQSTAYRWSAQDYTSVDQIPYVGWSPRMSRTLVATGFNKWGLTNGTAAAEMLADLVAGRDNPWLEAFDATRIGGVRAMKKLVEENVDVAAKFVGDRIARLRPGSVDGLDAGDGAIVDLEGHTVGAYRDAHGDIHAVNVTCTHLGCTLRWNRAETSWDCPCHGSRFSYDGTVLQGPAVRPLDRIDVEPEG